MSLFNFDKIRALFGADAGPEQDVPVPVRTPIDMHPRVLDAALAEAAGSLSQALLLAVGNVPNIKYVVFTYFVRFSVADDDEVEMDRLAAWLDVHSGVIDATHSMVVDDNHNTVLDVPMAAFKGIQKALAARQPKPKVYEGDDEDPNIVSVDKRFIVKLLDIAIAANALSEVAEYRVNHMFKGEAASFYVKTSGIEALRNALAAVQPTAESSILDQLEAIKQSFIKEVK